jgi:hypothetical protein
LFRHGGIDRLAALPRAVSLHRCAAVVGHVGGLDETGTLLRAGTSVPPPELLADCTPGKPRFALSYYKKVAEIPE